MFLTQQRPCCLLRVVVALCACSLAATLPASPVSDAFNGDAMFVEDTWFWPPQECRGHAEYSTVYLNGQYYMYYRSFYDQTGTYTGNITGIALATSTTGYYWTAYNGGRPVLPNRVYTNGPGTHEVAFFAPSVLVETSGTQPLLTMVFEVMDTGVGTTPGPQPRNYVEGATSTDGISWQPITDMQGNPRKLVTAQYPWEGMINGTDYGNVGTPSIHKFNGTYYIFYHGFSGMDGVGCLKRGFASGPSLGSLTKCSSNPVLLPPGDWGDAGIGRGDIVQDADGRFIMVFEGLRHSAVCGSTVTGWGLARSSDLIHWEYSSRNPERIDRVGPGCGEDMPSFQTIGSNVYVLTTTSNVSEVPAVRRYKIAGVPRPVSHNAFVAVAGVPSGDGYWELTQDGRVFAFGTAPSLGNVPLPARVRPVDIASTPSGQPVNQLASTVRRKAVSRR